MIQGSCKTKRCETQQGGIADLKESLKLKKKQRLRNNEYYSMQIIQDDLYKRAKKGYKFTNLLDYISCRDNILLAYRNIKKNVGSVTNGTDGKNIKDYEVMGQEEFIEYFQNKLGNYKPKSVRRVMIPKQGGKLRPLGIPCFEDRVIQQCIKQILEPICEAKFYKDSYGFRPNRSTHHAIAKCMYLMNRCNYHYVVDIDIEGFFDNVNHSKLKKQLWTLGIQDKNLISIIGKILKSEILGIGVPSKGTPQGGIISPLFSNVVLNELDWWISGQWDTIPTKYNYIKDRRKEGKGFDSSCKYVSLRRTNLKEMKIVRYADDFKIFCKDYKTAEKIFHAVRLWLKERLDLNISTEKSKITNLRRNYTEFLGLKMKVIPKRKKYVCKSKMSDKSKRRVREKFINEIKRIKKNCTSHEVNRFNSMILGLHNYFSCATFVNEDMKEINYVVSRVLYNRLKNQISTKRRKSNTYDKLYGHYNGKIKCIQGIAIFPIWGCVTKPPMNFNQNICNYTEEGRKLIHDKLGGIEYLMEYLLKNSHEKGDIELEDNKISLIAGQKGKCYVTKKKLEVYDMECHHKKPKEQGGSNAYYNLVWLCNDAHKLVHSKNEETITKYIKKLKLDDLGLKRVNSLRKLVGNSVI